jgi:hypothetical protein
MIWKLEACRDDERIGCKWGYAVAPDEVTALAKARATTHLPFVWAHPMHPDKLWPGRPGEDVHWSWTTERDAFCERRCLSANS